MNDVWPQQAIFADRVKEFCRKNGHLTQRGAIKMAVVADMFGLHEDTLRQLLQDTTRKRPYIDTLIQISSVLGCSVTEFLDAPSDPPPGMSIEKWSGLTERERMLASSFLSAIASDDMSIEEKEELHGVFQEGRERLLRLKKMWAVPSAKGD